MLNVEAEPLVMAFKREVAKMRERDAPDLEIQAMLEFVEQSVRWRENENRELLVSTLRKAAGLPPLTAMTGVAELFIGLVRAHLKARMP